MINRYEDIPWFFAISSDGQMRAFHERIIPLRLIDFDLGRSETLMTSDRMTLDLVSFQSTGDARHWKVYGEVNWPIVEDPLTLPDNAQIILPPIDQVVK